MDTLEQAARAYFGSDSRLGVVALLLALSGVAAVLLDGGSRRFNRLQFLGAAALIILLAAVTGLVVQAAIPTMVGSPAPPAWAQQSPVPPPPAGSDPYAGIGVPVQQSQQQPSVGFDPNTAVPVGSQQQPDATAAGQQPQTSTGANNGWVLMLADLGRAAGLGYVIGLVAMARCRDSVDKNQRRHAIAIVVLGAVFPLAYVLLLGKTKAGTPGLQAAQEAPAISGRNTLDDPIVIPETLIPGSQDYASMEYAFISRIHTVLKEEWKLKSQYLLTSNGRYVDKMIIHVKAMGRGEWDKEEEYYFDVTAHLKKASPQSYRASRVIVG